MQVEDLADNISPREFLEMVKDMCDNFQTNRPKPNSNEDIKLVLTRENIFDSFQECFEKQDHTRSISAFTTLTEDLESISGLYAIVIMVMNMYLKQDFLKKVYDLIVKLKPDRFLSGIIHFGVILFQVCDTESIISTNSYFFCISGKTYFLNNIFKKGTKFRDEFLPALRVLSNLVWFCFIHHELFTDSRKNLEVGYILKSLFFYLKIITNFAFIRNIKKMLV